MEKSELMKRYEAETGRKPEDLFMGSEESLIHFTREYVEWLEAQLTWRPMSVKPDKAGVYFVEGKPYAGCESTITTTAYFDGESFLWYVVVRWLPIPPAPAPEGEVK